MTMEEAQRELSRLTYKPGYTFTIHPFMNPKDQTEWWSVQLHTPAMVDRTQPTRLVELTQRRDYPIAAFETPAHVIAAARRVAQEWEHHEMLEWLCLDGAPLVDTERLHIFLPLTATIDLSA